MADTTFSPGTTITSEWLNDINSYAYNTAVYLPRYGAVGDGVTDDSIALQAAIDSGAPIISGNGRTYVVNNTLNLRSNLVLRDMALNFSGVGSGKTCISALGTGVVDSSPLASDAVSGGYTVDVALGTGSKFTAGDYVLLTAEDTYAYSAATVKRGEIKQVQSVATDTITFRQAIYEDYTTANTATLRKLSMLENIELDNVHVIGTNTEGDLNVGLKSNYVNGLRVVNCSFRDIDAYECALFNTINFDVSHNYFDGVRYTGVGLVFYGVVAFNCTQWGQVAFNRGQELRHLVTMSSSAIYYGQPYFVVVNGNVMNNAMAGDAYASWAYESHGFGRWVTWSNNIADSCHTGINIENGDQVVVGNIFRNCRYNGIYFDSDGNSLKNIIIANNLLSKATSESLTGSFFGISISANASQVRENILIHGNVIENFGLVSRSDFGIRVYEGSGDGVSCTISNNVVSNQNAYESTDYGIYIGQGGWIIRENTIRGYERALQVVTGANNCAVIGNHCSVSSISSTDTAIDIDSNANIIKGNFVRGMYRAISDGGTGNYVVDNTQIGCTVAQAVTTTTAADYTVLGTDLSIICNRAGTITLTLAAASATPGRRIRVKTLQAQAVVSASANVVPLASGIAGTAILAATAGEWAELVSDGTNWVVMQAG